jgi:hypothetical protein
MLSTRRTGRDGRHAGVDDRLNRRRAGCDPEGMRSIGPLPFGAAMPESLDPFVHTIDAAFDAGDDDIDIDDDDDDPATSLLEFLSSADESRARPAQAGSRRLVSLIVERDEA